MKCLHFLQFASPNNIWNPSKKMPEANYDDIVILIGLVTIIIPNIY